MTSDREIALEQALVAVLGAALVNGVDDKALLDRAMGLILGNGKFRTVDHPYVTMAAQAISDAHARAHTLNSL